MSWVVTMRASEPVLPPLRGDEIIVVPSSVLDELQDDREADWEDVVNLANEQDAAAVLVDRPQANGSPPQAPLLIASASFVASAELAINREITERRSDLYRLGSALSRVQASVPGAGGLDGFLTAAEVASGHPVMLVSDSGATIGRSRSAPRRLPASVFQTAASAPGEAEVLARGARAEWLIQGVQSRGLQRGALLAIGLSHGAPTEGARLVLRQLGEAIGTLYDRGAATAAHSGMERSAFIQDLLLGRRPLDDPLIRIQLSNLHLGPPLRVAILWSDTVAGNDLARQVLGSRPGRFGTQIDGDVVAILDSANTGDPEALRAVGERAGEISLVISEPITNSAGLTGAYRQARAFSRLARSGQISGPVIDLGVPLQAGAYGVLYSLGATTEAGRRLSELVEDVLRPLEQHDEVRRGELIPTLNAYLESGGSLTGAAERLGVHRNTLSYRLNRIVELIGQDLSDAHVRFLLQLVLAARHLERAMSD